MWHNHDRQEVDAETTLRGIGALGQVVRDLELEIVRVSPTPDGFVMQFVMRRGHRERESVRDAELRGRCDCRRQVSRIDEYVDGTVAAQLS